MKNTLIGYFVIGMLLAITLVVAQTNYNPVGSNIVTPTPNYSPVTQAYTNYTILPPSSQTNISNNNYIVVNITNNITNNVTTLVTNNITNNFTSWLNQSYYITNNLTNNITNIVENNVTTYINFTNNISNNYYAGWLTIVNNITENITVNVTTINNITNPITVNITTNSNETIIQQVNVTLVTENLTNNITINNYYNLTNSITPYLLTSNTSSDIDFNVTYMFESLYYNLTTNYIPQYNGSSLIDSPIQRIITDEDTLLFYDGDLYIDDTNGMVGVNIELGTESYNQAFQVNSKLIDGTGTISSTGVYDSVLNYTVFTTTNPIPEPLSDATTIRFGGNTYFVFNTINSNTLGIQGNHSVAITSSNWTWKQSPYIDVNGGEDEERGYTISQDGEWKWALLSPRNENSSQFCIQSSDKYFTTGNLCQMSMDTNGNVNVGGTLLAQGFYGGIYNTSTGTTTMTLQTVWYNLTGFTSDTSNGIIIGNSDMRVNQSGTYVISYYVSGSVNGADDISMRISVNNVSIAKSVSTIRYANGVSNVASWSMLYKFNVNDVITMQVSDLSSNNKIFTSNNKNIIMYRIGN